MGTGVLIDDPVGNPSASINLVAMENIGPEHLSDIPVIKESLFVFVAHPKLLSLAPRRGIEPTVFRLKGGSPNH